MNETQCVKRVEGKYHHRQRVDYKESPLKGAAASGRHKWPDRIAPVRRASRGRNGRGAARTVGHRERENRLGRRSHCRLKLNSRAEASRFALNARVNARRMTMSDTSSAVPLVFSSTGKRMHTVAFRSDSWWTLSDSAAAVAVVIPCCLIAIGNQPTKYYIPDIPNCCPIGSCRRLRSQVQRQMGRCVGGARGGAYANSTPHTTRPTGKGPSASRAHRFDNCWCELGWRSHELQRIQFLFKLPIPNSRF